MGACRSAFFIWSFGTHMPIPPWYDSHQLHVLDSLPATGVMARDLQFNPIYLFISRLHQGKFHIHTFFLIVYIISDLINGSYILQNGSEGIIPRYYAQSRFESENLPRLEGNGELRAEYLSIS